MSYEINDHQTARKFTFRALNRDTKRSKIQSISFHYISNNGKVTLFKNLVIEFTNRPGVSSACRDLAACPWADLPKWRMSKEGNLLQSAPGLDNKYIGIYCPYHKTHAKVIAYRTMLI